MKESTEAKLINETRKQLKKIEGIKVFPLNEKGKELVENINAYIKDCSYFLEKGQYIEAFEAIIWAWAWLEILEELGYLKVSNRYENH